MQEEYCLKGTGKQAGENTVWGMPILINIKTINILSFQRFIGRLSHQLAAQLLTSKMVVTCYGIYGLPAATMDLGAVTARHGLVDQLKSLVIHVSPVKAGSRKHA